NAGELATLGGVSGSPLIPSGAWRPAWGPRLCVTASRRFCRFEDEEVCEVSVPRLLHREHPRPLVACSNLGRRFRQSNEGGDFSDLSGEVATDLLIALILGLWSIVICQ